jgi:hypothetical protein
MVNQKSSQLLFRSFRILILDYFKIALCCEISSLRSWRDAEVRQR